MAMCICTNWQSISREGEREREKERERERKSEKASALFGHKFWFGAEKLWLFHASLHEFSTFIKTHQKHKIISRLYTVTMAKKIR